ncbi:MAG: hypothetical protein LBT01_00035 [Spirochaetaceae bacterium]|nr:hypothetical protein [Spirochaetaceae bacterium]
MYQIRKKYQEGTTEGLLKARLKVPEAPCGGAMSHERPSLAEGTGMKAPVAPCGTDNGQSLYFLIC